MKYYEVCSDLVSLSEEDSYVSSIEELNEFDLLVIDTKQNGFVTTHIIKEITNFEALAKPFEINSYLIKENIESYLRKKRAKSKREIILKKAEQEVKEIQYIEKLRKYVKVPSVKVLLDEYDGLDSED